MSRFTLLALLMAGGHAFADATLDNLKQFGKVCHVMPYFEYQNEMTGLYDFEVNSSDVFYDQLRKKSLAAGTNQRYDCKDNELIVKLMLKSSYLKDAKLFVYRADLLVSPRKVSGMTDATIYSLSAFGTARSSAGFLKGVRSFFTRSIDDFAGAWKYTH